MRTPWGRSDSVEPEGTLGLLFVGTPSHGGIKAPRALNAKIHPAWRRPGGWYEEDCEWAIPVLTFAHDFAESKVAEARRTAKSWFPDAYTTVTGEPVSLEESYILRERAFKAAHREHFVGRAAWGDWHETVPAGFVGVLARRESDGAEVWRLVPAAAYDAREHFGYVLTGAEGAWEEHA